jgi:hypothetical protein
MSEEIVRETQDEQAVSESGGAEAAVGTGLLEGLNTSRKAVVLAVLLVVALVSAIPLGNIFSDPNTYADTITTLDAKKETVMGLVGASAAASVGVSLLPGDAGTPIAQKLVDLSSDFIIVIAAIYLEKYLLTILGMVAFRILIPAACVLMAIAVALAQRLGSTAGFLRLARKLALLAIALVITVPASVAVSGMIEGTYQASIDATLSKAGQSVQAVEQAANESGAGETSKEESAAASDGWNPLTLFEDIGTKLQGIPDGVAGLVNGAQEALNGFIEALAVMIVTSCVIPILVLVFFLWLVKVILGVNMDAPMGMLRPRMLRRPKVK